MEWQPIETAPRDGTWVLLSGGVIDYGWDGETVPPAVVGQCTWTEGPQETRWQFAHYDSGFYGEYETPTHWAAISSPTSPADPATSPR